MERALRIGEVPGYLRHAESDPQDILLVHSAATLHLTMALAIRLWEENGKALTDAMREFNKRPSPYKPGYRHSAALEIVQDGSLPELRSIVTHESTASGMEFQRAPRRKGPRDSTE